MDLHVKSKKYNDADVLEVKEDLALKGEDLEVKKLTAETIEQSEVNDEIPFEVIEDVGIELVSGYFKCKVINNVMYLIAEGIFNTTADYTVGGNKYFFKINIPEKYRSRIKRWNDTDLTQTAIASNASISRFPVNISPEGTGLIISLGGLSSQNIGEIRIISWGTSGLQPSTNGHTISFRTELVLI